MSKWTGKCALILFSLAFPSCGSRTTLGAFDRAPIEVGGSSGSGGGSSMGAAAGRGGAAGSPQTGGAAGRGGAGGAGKGGTSGSAGKGGTSGSAGEGGSGGEAGGPPQVTDLAVGAFHTCAGFDDGSLRCWGTGGYIGAGNSATIGDDETPDVANDVDIGGNVQRFSAGWYQTCAVLDSGKVRCFGDGYSGLLGYGNVEDIGDDETPAAAGDVNVGGLVEQVAAAPQHTCACLKNGKVRCWGHNENWQLGRATTATIGDDEHPASAGDVDVGGFVVQVAGGFAHTCALLDTGKVRCWGTGSAGLLGYGNEETIGDNEPPASAGDVDIGGRVTKIVAGTFHTCALLETGTVRCWGRGYWGSLGYGNTEDIGDDETPAAAGDVDVGGPVTDLAAGDTATCVLIGGAVRCWGPASGGQLGYGNMETIGDNETPASAGNVEVGGSVTRIAVGFMNTCAVLAGGAVRCWGRGSTGALGYGNMEDIGDNETPASAGDVKVR